MFTDLNKSGNGWIKPNSDGQQQDDVATLKQVESVLRMISRGRF